MPAVEGGRGCSRFVIKSISKSVSRAGGVCGGGGISQGELQVEGERGKDASRTARLSHASCQTTDIAIPPHPRTAASARIFMFFIHIGGQRKSHGHGPRETRACDNAKPTKHMQTDLMTRRRPASRRTGAEPPAAEDSPSKDWSRLVVPARGPWPPAAQQALDATTPH